MDSLRRAIAEVEAMGKPRHDKIRASELGRDRLFALLPPALASPADRIYGMPVVIDPIIPAGFVALVGDSLEDTVFLDFRTPEERSGG